MFSLTTARHLDHSGIVFINRPDYPAQLCVCSNPRKPNKKVSSLLTHQVIRTPPFHFFGDQIKSAPSQVCSHLHSPIHSRPSAPTRFDYNLFFFLSLSHTNFLSLRIFLKFIIRFLDTFIAIGSVLTQKCSQQLIVAEIFRICFLDFLFVQCLYFWIFYWIVFVKALALY